MVEEEVAENRHTIDFTTQLCGTVDGVESSGRRRKKGRSEGEKGLEKEKTRRGKEESIIRHCSISATDRKK